MVRSERMDPKEKGRWTRVQGDKKYSHNAAHLTFLKNLDGRSVEVLCIDECPREDVVAVMETLDFGNMKTLILSRRAVVPCLLALERESNASGHGRWFLPVHTLIIRLDSHRLLLHEQVLEPLLCIAQKSKVAGFPLRSVSLFLRPEWKWGGVLEELRECIERLEVFTGDDILDWDDDKYFLDGLDHLQKNRDIRWD